MKREAPAKLLGTQKAVQTLPAWRPTGIPGLELDAAGQLRPVPVWVAPSNRSAWPFPTSNLCC